MAGIWLQQIKAPSGMQMQMSLSISMPREAQRSGHGHCRPQRQPSGRVAQPSGCICLMAMLILLMVAPDFIVGLKDVSVMIPQAVKRGSNALLTCNYDMENDTLYSVKWYKGKREFYRYTPKENPAMKVFAMTSGLNVERNLSNQSHVVLHSVPLNISGKFTCEISVEAPTFQTAMVSGEMEVVELPEEHTMVTGIQARYRIGDLVDGNCSIKYSKPAANLTWTINGIVVPPHHIKTYQIEKLENSTLESVMSAVNFMVTTQHFLKGQMRLKCTANIFDIFKEEIESIIEEDRPRIMASGRSYDINNYPLEEHTNGDRGFEDHNESYLTYFAGNDVSSGAATAAHQTFWHAWTSKVRRLLRQITELHQYKSGYIIRQSAMSIASKFDDAMQRAQRVELMLQQKLKGSQLRWVAVAVLGALGCLLAHQINDCQHNSGSQKAAKCAEIAQPTPPPPVLDVSVTMTMSKAMAVRAKCFYNCRMATLFPTLQRQRQRQRQQDAELRYVQRQRRNDDHVDDDADDDDDDGNIQSAGNDLTAGCQQLSVTLATPMPASASASTSTAAAAAAAAIEARQTLVDQGLLMTSMAVPVRIGIARSMSLHISC